MKKLLILGIVSMSFLLIGCGDNKNDGGIPEEELPQESSICPEGFYRFDSVKRCMNIENVE